MKRKTGIPKGTILKGLTKEILIERLKEITALLGHQVSYRELRKLKGGWPSPTAYVNRFGSWSEAIKQAGFPPLQRGTKGKRKAVLKNSFANLRMRFEVFQRDNFTCQYCGRTPQEGAKLVADHKDPVANGGETRVENLITACFECNAGKSDVVLSTYRTRRKPKRD